MFGNVRVLLKLEKICIDNNIFRLHYKITVIMLAVFSLIVTSKQYFGDPIQCHAQANIDKNVVDAYCWIHSTFTVTKHFTETAAHPGVGDFKEKEDAIVYNKYYQWVCFVLFFQVCFILLFLSCYVI